MFPALVSLDAFRARLTELETWLWADGWRRSGVAGPVPKTRDVAACVETLSDIYTIDRGSLERSTGEADHLVAKLLYFLCSDAPKAWFVLTELAARWDQTPEPAAGLRVFDIGCGVGATAVGVLLGLDGRRTRRVSLDGLDTESASLRVWDAVVRKAAEIAGVELVARSRLGNATSSDVGAGYDLVLAQAVLNELFHGQTGDAAAARRADWMAGHLGLTPGRGATGRTLVVIEPALRETTRPLMAARDRLAASGATLLGPCLHAGACPMLPSERDWCHEVRQFDPTPRVREVQVLTRRRDDRVKYSFVAFASSPLVSRLSSDAPNLTGRLVSEPLGSKGKTERHLCMASGELVRVRLLDRERSEGNTAMIESERGTIVRLGGAASMPRVTADTTVEPL